MKETYYKVNEWCYFCPYCNHLQGYTEFPNDTPEYETCDECGKDFVVKKKCD